MAVELAELCKALHVLPGPGGLLDQNYHHIMMLRAGIRAINIKQEHENKKAQAASKARPRRSR